MSIHAAEARHQIANLLHTYVAIADRKDVDAVVDLLGSTQVHFPTAGSMDPAGARQLFTQLWSSPEEHRHIVNPAQEEGQWLATAHYTRWLLGGDAPLVHTLGQYELLVDGVDWSLMQLKVSRIWTAGT
ncbi:nuclear transport factor 2 family protein [Arthrobacter sedimenti]|uniref:nuclear transport factor 2 family protein n=1 Tax=Arthrobacter sedimenti TaxID=2694931 RepID=UPI001423A0A6|nr:nuclear transport factor 2 family protein [Arthrobacter sedimenti]